MGAMLLFVLGILSAVGLSLYQFSEQYRFDMVSDAKNGGVFIIDKKAAALNYCDDKKCLLIGGGALPSQIMNNPATLASLQNAIMVAPAAVVTPKPGQAPEGMENNIASSEEQKKAHESEENTQKADSNSDDSSSEDDDDKEDDSKNDDKDEDDKDEHADTHADANDESTEEKAPEGFDF